MNAIKRFLTLGLQDADHRVAAALAPRPLEDADRYLAESVIVRTIDRGTWRLHEWWLASRAAAVLQAIDAAFRSQRWAARYQSIAIVLIAAVVTHLLLTIAQGAHQGWFWGVIPALVATFAFVLLAASSQSDR
jgi:hypothetical protein